MDIHARLTDVFRQTFDDASLVIRPEMTSNDIVGWDSLSHVNLILAVETAFGIRFSQREVLGFRNVGDLEQCIERKLR